VKPSFAIPRNEESIAVHSNRKTPLPIAIGTRVTKESLSPELYARKRVTPYFVIPRNEESLYLFQNNRLQSKRLASLCHSEARGIYSYSCNRPLSTIAIRIGVTKESLSPELYARKRVKPPFVIPRHEESILTRVIDPSRR
jgi:hypothetical protein